jgi:uncharacterized protein (TIRG00374 family)
MPIPDRIKTWLRFVLRYTIAAILLIYLFNQIPLESVIAAVRHAELAPFLAALLISFSIQPVIADRLRRLGATQALYLSTPKVIQINLVALFYGLFLPGGNIAGNFIRLYSFSGNEKRYVEAGIIILLDRLFAAITLCVTGIIFLFWESTSNAVHLLKVMTASVALLLAVTGILCVCIPRLNLRNRKMVPQIVAANLLSKLHAPLQRLRNLSPGIVCVVSGISFAAHLLGILTYYLATQALGLDLGIVTIAWIRSAMILATMVPISVAGLGIRETTTYLLMSNYGVLGKDSIAFSLLIFIITILAPGLIGGFWETRRLLTTRRAK